MHKRNTGKDHLSPSRNVLIINRIISFRLRKTPMSVFAWGRGGEGRFVNLGTVTFV
jgi:hypothetical protein